MSSKREQFIKELYAQTYQLAQDEGIPHDFIMAQVIQETGWGEHILEGTNNLFNIKAGKSWEGERATFRVWEVEHGRKVWTYDTFRKYDSYKESVADWMHFLQSNKRYEALFMQRDLSTEEFARRIQDAGYATDPNYAHNIVRITQGRTYKDLVGKAAAAYAVTHREEKPPVVSTQPQSDKPVVGHLVPHKLEDFEQALFEEIALREGFRSHIYLDSVGIPTIGYGHAFFTSRGDLNIQAIRDVQASGMKVSYHDYRILRKIEHELHHHPRHISRIRHMAKEIRLTVNHSEAKTLFLHAMAHKMDDLKEKIGSKLYHDLADSKELLALADLTYNGGAGILYPSLLKALHEGNREEVWYKIRYTTNGGHSRSKGIANRRVAESNIFGLTNPHVTQEDITRIEALMHRHHANIVRQEAAFPVTRVSPSPNPYAGINAMQEQLAIAKHKEAQDREEVQDSIAQSHLGVEVDISEITLVSKHEAQQNTNNATCDMPPWMKIAIDQARLIAGRDEDEVDDVIRKYHKAATGSELNGAHTAWCASFVSWALKESGMQNTPRSAGSRYFRDESENPRYGAGLKPIPKGEEKLGDIAVWADLDKYGHHKGTGHVSFVFGKDDEGNTLFLGGNQGDTLAVKEYATEKTQKREFVGYFRPEEAQNSYETCDLTKYSSVLAANQAAIGQEMEIGESTR